MKTCECCSEKKDDVLKARRVTGNGNCGISEPYSCSLCEDCEQGFERCDHCGVYYDETALPRSMWVCSTPNYGQGDDVGEIIKEMVQLFLCDDCVENLLHKKASEQLLALFRKLDYWHIIEALLGGGNDKSEN